MATATTQTQRIAIILNSLNDWDEWLEVIKTKAVGGKIWKYIDLSMDKNALPTLEKPTIPSVKDINSQKTTIAKLTENE